MKKIDLHRFLVPVIAVALILLVSCHEKVTRDQETEKSEINSFLAENPNYTFDVKASGLYYCSITEGTGLQAELHDTAYIKYVCSLLSGITIDYTPENDTLVMPVGENLTIPGFDEGISYLREGGTAMFIVPSSLAYGSIGSYGIDAYTPLLFRVQLGRLEKYAGKK